MNIFFRELKANAKSLVIWSVCLFLLVLSGMTKYTAYSSSRTSSDIFNKMPYGMKALFGFGSFDVTKMKGFFAVLFPYIVLAAAIHAVLIGNGIIAKEERDKTTEFLMVKPVSRNSIITHKLLAALFNIIIVNLVSLASSLIITRYYDNGKDVLSEVMFFLLSMFFIQLIFMSLGAFIAALMKNPKASGTAVTGILIGSYIISKVTDLTDKVNILNLFSPFKYFSYKDIVNGKGLSITAVILSLILSVAFTGAVYLFYEKRDLKF